MPTSQQECQEAGFNPPAKDQQPSSLSPGAWIPYQPSTLAFERGLILLESGLPTHQLGVIAQVPRCDCCSHQHLLVLVLLTGRDGKARVITVHGLPSLCYFKTEIGASRFRRDILEPSSPSLPMEKVLPIFSLTSTKKLNRMPQA